MTAPRIPRGMVPLVSGHRRGSPGGVERTAVEGGPARYALAYDRGLQTYDVALKLSALEMSVWNVFYTRTLRKGAVSFTMPLDSGHGVQDHLVNILPNSYADNPLPGGAPQPRGRTWVVTFQVEAENHAYEFDDAAADALLDLYESAGSETDELLRRLMRFSAIDLQALDFWQSDEMLRRLAQFATVDTLVLDF